jgi:glycerol-1-phosphate dehydrogenase [NAD(P)+]
MDAPDYIPLVEAPAAEVLAALGPFTLCASDPPWSSLAARLPRPERVVPAWDMDAAHLETLLTDEPDTATVVGFGGGSALDTAKFIAWRTGKRLVQIPTITSVDAAFTDAVGVREAGKVRYVGQVLAERVVLDVDLVRSAPSRLNRAGIGDVLSCHTGLHDWKLSVAAGRGPAWDADAAALGETLLAELAEVVDEVARVSPTAVRWLASAYRRIGAMCHRIGHSCFEEGSEHYFGYAYEHLSGAHPLHGELIGLGVLLMSTVQQNDPNRVRDLLVRSHMRCHPADIGMTREHFEAALSSLREYVEREGLGHSVVDTMVLDSGAVRELWTLADALPRRST